MPPRGEGLHVETAVPPLGTTPACKESPTGGIRMGGRESMYADDLQRIASGDEAALTRIIEEFAPLVRAVALGVTGNEADAEDVVQDVFIGLPEALGSFSGGNFPGWLKVVARSRAQMLVRTERRRQQFRSSSSTNEGSDDRALNRIMIERAITELDAKQREVFVLKWREGLSHQEIAELMDISENYSQVLLHRARKALREMLS
jgi:RNA polymerase sigma-70 factor (ECF subfamily)